MNLLLLDSRKFSISFSLVRQKQNLYLRKPSNQTYQMDEIKFLPDFRSPRQTLGKTDPLRGGMWDGRRHDLIALHRERLRLQRVVIVVIFLFVLAGVISFIRVLLVKRIQIVLLYKRLKKKTNLRIVLFFTKIHLYCASKFCYFMFSPGTSLLLLDEVGGGRRRGRGSHAPHHADAVLRQRRETQS